MFRPNLNGYILFVSGRDLHGRETYSAPVPCPFAAIDLATRAQRTTVRADSSASRGAADETVSGARIMIVNYVAPRIGDRFTYGDAAWKIVMVHPRRSVFGGLDHYECEMEALPA